MTGGGRHGRDRNAGRDRSEQHRTTPTPTARRGRALVALPTTAALVLGLAGLTAATTLAGPAQARPTGSPAAATVARAEIRDQAPVFAVTSDGLSQAEAKELASRAGIAPALEESGLFSYVDPKRYGKVPTRAGARSKDEAGRRTVERPLARTKLRALETLDPKKATALASELLRVPEGFEATPQVSHTTLDLSDLEGRSRGSFDLDTTVSFDLTLAGRRVVGPGSRARVAFAADGTVIALTAAVREVSQSGTVGIVGPDTALAQCARLYGDGVTQLEPELVYSSPALSAKARPEALLPHYACRPATEVRADPTALGRLVPAAPDLTPQVTLSARGDGTSVKAGVQVTGGQAPYTVRWSSSSTRLKGALTSGEQVGYVVKARGKGGAGPESLTATVTDANGIVSAASVTLDAQGGEATAEGYGGDGGLFSVGIEQTVDEWQCAQDSANGFSAEMRSHGEQVAFDWRGMSAWERDFRNSLVGGNDRRWVDAVDAQWYTGHGNPDGFTFKNQTHDDRWIVPADARWGDNVDLEWMQLESCQVLRDTTGTGDYFQRWGDAFDGLHLLNGFHTNARCVGGGTGRRFASYLFPAWWRPGLTVVQAWQAMAGDLEPTGTVWRSVSPAKAGWVTNLSDHYWGQGSTGPDIRRSQLIGWASVSGTV